MTPELWVQNGWSRSQSPERAHAHVEATVTFADAEWKLKHHAWHLAYFSYMPSDAVHKYGSVPKVDVKDCEYVAVDVAKLVGALM